ncbi:type VI secretion system protein TssA [Marivita sp. XM-24bin2]|jgi:type VI secretion system protein ImpA|uniref:type VI secretion system protein TssA n=1 Tax=unclassified Marivita TaxID=2632480 RepID=UPI000D7B59D4|nr:type VI secretion system protein TssA [Marivita sp. XM-24bin2]MCR9108573.1 type VI secretion system protein TssA [Paracoccaceae bacterium]PWL36127.1 MAG: type VI secretion system protein TssA [Marivita sp. XM-24bin2]
MLKSLGEDAPSGENLEYDPDFIAMELAGQPEEERQAGTEIVEGSDPDYKDLASKARVVLERTHDIRAAVYLADSEVRLNGLSGFAEMTSYIRGCLEEYWDTCHPQLDEEDDNDPMMRINAVSGLGARSTVVRGLRTSAPLTNSRVLGRVTLRDIDIANGEAEASDDETPMSSSEIDAAFTDTSSEDLEAYFAAASSAFEDVNAIDAIFLEKTPGYGPSLEDLQKVLSKIVKVLSKYVQADAPETIDDDQGDEAGVARPAAARGGGAPGSIETRADVTAALDRIMDYYARHEPSSPLPILLKRAKRLVGAEFLEIINDLAPEGVANVRLIGGVTEEETESDSSSSDW